MANDQAAAAAQQSLQARAAAALQKQQRGEKLTAKERRDIERWREQVEEKKRQEHYATVPKKDFCALAARQHKLVDDFHRNYGAPVDGKEVDLFKFVKWVFDFMSENGRKLNRVETEDELLLGDANSPALERLREASYTLKCIEISERRKEIIPRDEAHAAMSTVAAHLRSCGLALQERFGRDALDILLQHLDAAEAEVQAKLGQQP